MFPLLWPLRDRPLRRPQWAEVNHRRRPRASSAFAGDDAGHDSYARPECSPPHSRATALPRGPLADDRGARTPAAIVRVGAFRPHQRLGDEDFRGGVASNRRNAIRAYGTPDGKSPQGCPNKWKRSGVRMRRPPTSAAARRARRARRSSRLVITAPRLDDRARPEVGDSLDRVRELYPELQRVHGALRQRSASTVTWALVLEPSQVGGPAEPDRPPRRAEIRWTARSARSRSPPTARARPCEVSRDVRHARHFTLEEARARAAVGRGARSPPCATRASA